jgi:sugar/nucleoside kinase (ribokinase family)
VGDYTLEMGGSCSIFACQAAKLGLKVAILGRVGPDSFGELMIRRMAESGVDTRYVKVDPALKTGLGIALCQEHDRAILTYMGSVNALKPENVTDDFLASARHLHHGSHYLHTGLRPAIPDIFRRARQLGLTISLDTNWDPEERWDGGLAEILPVVDVFLPNDAELRHITRQDSIEEAAASLLAKGTPLVAVKQGVEGASAFSRAGVVHQAVEPVSGGDSIGAGDSFDAGFLTAWLRGYDQPTCLKIACACGRSVASRVGGVAGQPYWKDVQP